MKSIKTHLGAAAAALAIAGTGLVVATPAPASAVSGITPGNYWFEAWSYGIIPTGRAPATVKNGRLTIYGGLGMRNVKRIHPTPRGAYVDQDGFQRHVYKPTGKRRYYATIMLGAVPVGNSTLNPRR